MKRTAEIVSISENIVEIKVTRSSMCDGCSAKSDGCTCSHAIRLGADTEMLTKAVCELEVSVGDIVEIETSDSRVLIYAMLVFMFPIIVCAICFAAASRIFDSGIAAFAVSAAGFVLSFAVIGVIERRHRSSNPDITVVSVISHNSEN